MFALVLRRRGAAASIRSHRMMLFVLEASTTTTTTMTRSFCYRRARLSSPSSLVRSYQKQPLTMTTRQNWTRDPCCCIQSCLPFSSLATDNPQETTRKTPVTWGFDKDDEDDSKPHHENTEQAEPSTREKSSKFKRWIHNKKPIFQLKDGPSPMERANLLLDGEKYPVGSFTHEHYMEVKYVLDWVKWSCPKDARPVNTAFLLLERLVRDLAIHRQQDLDLEWVFKLSYFRRIFHVWKNVAIDGQQRDRVISPKDLMRSLCWMSNELPRLHFHPSTPGVIMDAVIKRELPNKAPEAAEDFLDFFRNEVYNTGNYDLRLNVFVYSQVLQAWAKSFQPEAAERMDALLHTMRRERIAPTEITYNIFLRFLSQHGKVDRITEVLTEMVKRGIKPSLMTFAQAVHGFTKVGQLERSEKLIRGMEALEPKEIKEMKLLCESVQELLQAYRGIVDSETNREVKARTVERAEELFHRIEQFKMSIDSRKKLTGTMMDIYARAEQAEKAAALSERLHRSHIQITILTKAYGMADQADKATQLVKDFLDSPDSVYLNMRVFTTLLNAWADSSQPDAFEQAIAVRRLMETHPKCREFGVHQPKAGAFCAILKCLANSRRDDAVEKAVEILDEMERLYKTVDQTVKPDENAFALAIHICLQAGDVEKADTLLGRMEKCETARPNSMAIDIILHGWIKHGDLVRATEFLVKMRQLYESKRLPSGPAEHTYKALVRAWEVSEHPKKQENIMNLKEKMIALQNSSNEI